MIKRIAAFLLAFFCALPAWAVDWTHVQGKSVVNSGTTLTFTSAVTSGSGVCGGVLLSTGFTLTSVTDNQSNAYTVFNTHDDGTLYTASFRSNGFITNGPTTLTYHLSGSPGNSWFVQDEFQPPTGATSLSVDGSSSTFASAGTSFTSFSTTLSDDLVYAASFSSGTSTHGASFNAGTGDGTAVMSEWGIQSAAGSVTMNMATQTGSFWGPAFALNAGGAAPSAPPPRTLIGVGK